MPTFDVQAALQSGVSQDTINQYLAAHPDVQASTGTTTPPAATAPAATGPTKNPSAAPVVGSIGDIGEGITAAAGGFTGAHESTALNNQRGAIAQQTQQLIEAAAKQSDPARRARLLQVAHDNLAYISRGMAQTANMLMQEGTGDVHVPGAGTVSAPTSAGQAAGTAIKTLSMAAPEIAGAALPATAAAAVTGGLYGAGNTLEENGDNTTPGQLALHTTTNAAGFALAGKAGEIVLSNIASGIGPVLTKLGMTDLGPTITKMGGYSGNTGAVSAGGNVISKMTDYWDAASQQLVKSAQDLTDANPNLVIGSGQRATPTIVSMLQKLKDTGIDLSGTEDGFTPADVQNISSKLNQMAQASPLNRGEIQAVNDTFRSWAQKSFNDIVPKSGDALETAYANTAKQYQTFQKLGNVINIDKNSTQADASALIKTVKTMASDPNDKIILNNAIKDFSSATGIDFSDEAKAMQYVAKAGPIVKSVVKEIVKYVAGGSSVAAAYDIGKHLGL